MTDQPSQQETAAAAPATETAAATVATTPTSEISTPASAVPSTSTSTATATSTSASTTAAASTATVTTSSSPSSVLRVVVFYYSLTGNTAYVAKRIAQELNEAGSTAVTSPSAPEGGARPISADAMDVSNPAAKAALADAHAIGFGGLTWGYKEPPPLREWMAAIQPDSVRGKRAFVFTTCGGNQGRALSNMANTLSSKGAIMIGELTLLAPSNYTCWNPPKGVKQLWGSEERDKITKFSHSLIPKLLASTVQSLSIWGSAQGYALGWLGDWACAMPVGEISVDKSKCIKCDLCVRQCPFGALTRSAEVEDAPIVWNKKKCLGCCRCINNCPKNCINSSSTVGKSPYKLSDDNLTEGHFSVRRDSS
ncbi:hypothetical protein Pelo_11806 [Pelomyxa schiedti]|nr:hypothetical protein Pelo_11806 [Pelomyxa schiedti]